MEAVEASARERLNVAAAKLKAEAAARADAESRAVAVERELAAVLSAGTVTGAAPCTPAAPVPLSQRSGGRQRRMARLHKQQAACDALHDPGPQSSTTEELGGHWAAVGEAQREMARRFGCEPVEAAQRAELNLATARRLWAAQSTT